MRHRPGICLARSGAFRSSGRLAAMSQDENAELRRRLSRLWTAFCGLFVVLSPEMDTDGGGNNHPKPKASTENAESLLGASVQPSYRGGWRNLASSVSLVGSAMFGASFNFLGHNDVAFFAVAAFGIGFMLFGVCATFKHDQREQRQRDDIAIIERKQQVARDRSARIQKVADTYFNTIRPLMQNTVDENIKTLTIIMAGVSTLSTGETCDLLNHVCEHGLLPPRFLRIQQALERTFPPSFSGPPV